jgi:hypothetical protein
MPIGEFFVYDARHLRLIYQDRQDKRCTLRAKKMWYEYKFTEDEGVWTFAPQGYDVSFQIQGPTENSLKVFFTGSHTFAVDGISSDVAPQGVGWACWELSRANEQGKFHPVYSLPMKQPPHEVSRSIRKQCRIQDYLRYKHIPKSLRYRITKVAIDHKGQIWVVRDGHWEMFLNRKSEDHRLIAERKHTR